MTTADVDAVRQLMEADRWVDRVHSQRDHLPELQELVAVEQELRGFAAQLSSLESERRPARDKFNEAADRASSLRQRRGDLELRLQNATAPARELTPMQTELERLTKSLNDAEDREIALLMDLEPLDEAVTDVRSRAAPLAHRRHDLQESVKALQATLDDELVHLRHSRDEVATTVTGTLRARYDAALLRAGVSGAAVVDGGRCDGCRVALSPLDLDRTRGAAATDPLDCPHCGRLLLC